MEEKKDPMELKRDLMNKLGRSSLEVVSAFSVLSGVVEASKESLFMANLMMVMFLDEDGKAKQILETRKKFVGVMLSLANEYLGSIHQYIAETMPGTVKVGLPDKTAEDIYKSALEELEKDVRARMGEELKENEKPNKE